MVERTAHNRVGSGSIPDAAISVGSEVWFCLLLFGCLVLAIGAKAMGWIS